MTNLSVNLNAVAYLRNRRDLPWPSVTRIARLVLDAGADGITVHPRPDERHIRRTDALELARLVQGEYPHAEYNIEGYPSVEFMELVETAAPDQVTFVPDDPSQSTSDHGWDIAANHGVLVPAIARMKATQIRVSLFIDPVPAVAAEAAALSADRIELYTAGYGGSFTQAAAEPYLKDLAATARLAQSARLAVNAGHDLTLENLPAFQRAVPGIAEVSIGHAITSDALLMGFPEAVRLYKAALAAA